jgi:hypothetical protein
VVTVASGALVVTCDGRIRMREVRRSSLQRAKGDAAQSGGPHRRRRRGGGGPQNAATAVAPRVLTLDKRQGEVRGSGGLKEIKAGTAHSGYRWRQDRRKRGCTLWLDGEMMKRG